MVWLKSCPRCGGDLYMEEAQFGSYVSCFQCGAAVADFDENATASDVVEALEGVVEQAKVAL
ncbi:MAG: hypothetical protein O3A33_00700 [Chloroflexi bacterium]|nr:hypothetical protein [Chloroflexota bacterium]